MKEVDNINFAKRISSEILWELGFHELGIPKSKKKEETYDPGYTHKMIIGFDTSLYYDKHGFITIKRKTEKKGPRGTSMDSSITLPKPFRSPEKLKNFLDSML